MNGFLGIKTIRSRAALCALVLTPLFFLSACGHFPGDTMIDPIAPGSLEDKVVQTGKSWYWTEGLQPAAYYEVVEYRNMTGKTLVGLTGSRKTLDYFGRVSDDWIINIHPGMTYYADNQPTVYVRKNDYFYLVYPNVKKEHWLWTQAFFADNKKYGWNKLTVRSLPRRTRYDLVSAKFSDGSTLTE
jgi:hypothetical protein